MLLSFTDVSCSHETSMEVDTPTFTPRPRVEPVTNCSLVSHSVQDSIIKLITDRLLATNNYKSICIDEQEIVWNAGG